jgi:hypothetical protein
MFRLLHDRDAKPTTIAVIDENVVEKEDWEYWTGIVQA